MRYAVPREIGSEFHWDPAVLTAGGDWLPARHELFATGCGALSALLRHVGPPGRLHVPSYFCMGVAEALAADVPIAFYRHLPDDGGPRWETLHARDGDIVLAQNLFGRDDGEPWNAWRDAHPGVTVVEDHSHDPLSGWARASSAPYAVASLRKTLPVPDGGLLWSPTGREIPRPEGRAGDGAHLKLAAMLLKSAWLDGRPIPKDEFRVLQQRGEQTLLGSAGPATAFTAAVLPLIDASGLRDKGIANARALAAEAPVTAGPFRAQLVCRTSAERDGLLKHLAAHGIYAPVHWRQDRGSLWSGDDEAADLAGRMLTVPVDHRCSAADVRRIAAVLLAAPEAAALDGRDPPPRPAPAA
ncbi:hypothetical protein ACIA5D_41700 [Actinoplanes sp. NPDC051513]|uniref:hypothetical protein n=1 Tax=Actinoplanes sp. NPDC051513 TaxID=3363908 RepID=UPI0037877646